MQPGFVYNAKVVSVYDGDTVRVDIDLGFGVWTANQAVRLLGVNTPEMRGRDAVAGKRVRDWLRRLVLGKQIVLRTKKDSKGKYGRWLGEIWIDDQCVNDELIKQGFGREY